MKVLISLSSYFSLNNWVVPSEEKLRQEYRVEYQLKGLGNLLGNPFPTVGDFLKAIKNPHTELIDSEKDKRIAYRSRCTDMETLRALVSSYRSWPEFRNDKTLNAIVEGFTQNHKMEMPIVLERDNGSRRIFSGNTRMDIAYMLKVTPQVIILRIP